MSVAEGPVWSYPVSAKFPANRENNRVFLLFSGNQRRVRRKSPRLFNALFGISLLIGTGNFFELNKVIFSSSRERGSRRHDPADADLRCHLSDVARDGIWYRGVDSRYDERRYPGLCGAGAGCIVPVADGGRTRWRLPSSQTKHAMARPKLVGQKTCACRPITSATRLKTRRRQSRPMPHGVAWRSYCVANSMMSAVGRSSSGRPCGTLRCVERCWPSVRQVRRSETPSVCRTRSMHLRRREGLRSFPVQPP